MSIPIWETLKILRRKLLSTHVTTPIRWTTAKTFNQEQNHVPTEYSFYLPFIFCTRKTVQQNGTNNEFKRRAGLNPTFVPFISYVSLSSHLISQSFSYLNAILGPVASGPPGNLWDMRPPHPRPSEQELWEWDPAICFRLQGDSDACLSSRTTHCPVQLAQPTTRKQRPNQFFPITICLWLLLIPLKTLI